MTGAQRTNRSPWRWSSASTVSTTALATSHAYILGPSQTCQRWRLFDTLRSSLVPRRPPVPVPARPSSIASTHLNNHGARSGRSDTQSFGPSPPCEFLCGGPYPIVDRATTPSVEPEDTGTRVPARPRPLSTFGEPAASSVRLVPSTERPTMDVQLNHTRERVFSILNDSDNPSFVIRQKPSSPSPPPARLPSISTLTRLERPNFLRQTQYQRNSSVSSSSSPPLLRFDSTSSKSSSSSMDSTPSPITPAYNYTDTTTTPAYDVLLRTDLGPAYLNPSTITPLMEQQMLLTGPGTQLPTFEPKPAPPLPTLYPGMPLMPAEVPQLPTPTLSNDASVSSTSSSATHAKTSPAGGNPPPGKKNKYPCPYAQSHNCLATFTTSGHAARHGKKHTGEKGVHCPVCNKAFTRKDNMKQHERTHKNKNANPADATRSKAAITKDAQKVQQHKKTESIGSTSNRRASLIQSPLSEATTVAPNTADTPKHLPEPMFYQDPSPPLLMATDPALALDPLAPAMYPPMADEALLVNPVDKLDSIPMAPTLIRGFSDLETLAHAAETFDPYYPTQF